MKIKLEYVWLDGYEPEPNLRSKVKVIDFGTADIENPLALIMPKIWDIPEWSFDGSSTNQAEGSSSDCILKPVKLYQDPLRNGFSYLVMCEVMNPDNTPHKKNTRSRISVNEKTHWFGFEQEYVLRWFNKNENRPLGFENFNPPEKQGKYYCSVGHPYSAGREIVEEHMDACLSCGIDITGTNAEVMLGQWEYQVFSKGNKNAGDDLWMSRFILNRIAEKYRVKVDYHPKPMGSEEDWNGSGMHVNFSDKIMRESGRKDYFDCIFKELESRHKEAIEIYGSDNEQRLTGNHETQSIDKFSWGISDRGASVRIPIDTAKEWKGYLEDRRPASNSDPYLITAFMGGILSPEVKEIELQK